MEELLALGHQVSLAGSGDSLSLLQQHFPTLNSRVLPAYAVRYPSGRGLILALLAQVPRLLRVIKQEHQQIEQWVQQEDIDLVISDNRYGLWSKQVPSYFICHQLAPLPTPTWAWIHWFVFQLHLRWLRPFEEIWVPDFPAPKGLAGYLAHRFAYPKQAHFIGPLSRFEKPIQETRPYEEIDIAIILSGPEPQRTLLEQQLITQAKTLDRKVLLVQGKPQLSQEQTFGQLTVTPYLNAAQLHRVLQQAQIVISRPGYSSLMDYAALGLAQVILIPTPGQTEQQHLADKLMQQGTAPSFPQKNFSLQQALAEGKHYQGFKKTKAGNTRLRENLSRVLSSLS